MISLLRSSFKIALGSLLVSKVRSLLTILGVVIGVAAVIILVSVGSGLRQLINQQFFDLGANLLLVLPGKVELSQGINFQQLATSLNSSKIDEEDLKIVESAEGVEVATPLLNSFLPVSFQGRSKVFEVAGTNQNLLKMLNWPVGAGRFFSLTEIELGQKVTAVGFKISQEFFAGNPLGQNLIVGHERFRVIGVLSPKGGVGQHDWDAHVFLPLGAAKRLLGEDNLEGIYVKAQESARLSEVVSRIKSLLLRRHREDEFTVLEQGDLLRTVGNLISAVTLALSGIAAISLLVGGIGIMNIMLVSVAERTREIGLRKAVGARNRDILWQFLLEATVLSGLGGVLGILLGVLGSLALSRVISTQVTGWSVILSFGVAVLTGIIFGLLPAYKAAQLDPVDALRYE